MKCLIKNWQINSFDCNSCGILVIIVKYFYIVLVCFTLIYNVLGYIIVRNAKLLITLQESKCSCSSNGITKFNTALFQHTVVGFTNVLD